LQLSDPLPLAVFPEGCYYRDGALRLLEQHGKPYRIAFTSHSQASLLAAVRAGIGIVFMPRATLETGMVIIDEGLPTLPQTDTTLFVAASVNEATARLARAIEESLLLRNGS
jgi:DNA-binding transcriptional LysR family regulator